MNKYKVPGPGGVVFQIEAESAKDAERKLKAMQPAQRENYLYVEPQYQPRYDVGVLDAVGQGLTSNFSDELLGLVDEQAGLDYQNDYNKWRDENTWKALGGEIAGSVAQEVVGRGLLSKALKRAPLPPQSNSWKKEAMVGAAHGALSAYGATPQELDDIYDIGAEVLQGGVMGGATSFLMNRGTNAAKNAWGRFSKAGERRSIDRTLQAALEETVDTPSQLRDVPRQMLADENAALRELGHFAVTRRNPERMSFVDALDARNTANKSEVSQEMNRVLGNVEPWNVEKAKLEAAFDESYAKLYGKLYAQPTDMSGLDNFSIHHMKKDIESITHSLATRRNKRKQFDLPKYDPENPNEYYDAVRNINDTEFWDSLQSRLGSNADKKP